MKNKIFFSEGRLVFKKDPNKVSAAAGDNAVEVQAVPDEKGLGEGRDVRKEGVMLRADMQFDQIKQEMGKENYVTLLRSVDAEGGIYEADLPDGFELDDWAKGEILDVIKDRVKAADLEGVSQTLLSMKESELKMVLIAVYEAKVMKSIKSEIKRMKPIYEEYMKDNPDTEASYKVMIARGDQVSIKFYPNDLNTFAKKRDAEKNPEDETSEEQIEVITNAKLLMKTPLGKMMKWLGFTKKDFTAIAKGENIFGVMLFGMAGYKEGGIDKAYAELKEMIPEDKRGFIVKWEEKLRKSSVAAKGAETGGKDGELAYTGMKTKAFEGFLSGKKLDQNYALEEGYSIPDGKAVAVTLTGDSRIIVPKGKSIVFDGESREAKEEDLSIASAGAQSFITGKIPAGVKFSRSIYVDEQTLSA